MNPRKKLKLQKWLVVDSVTFPKGCTIYGRWTEIDVNSGTIVAYQGI